jgi:hypothetical protein
MNKILILPIMLSLLLIPQISIGALIGPCFSFAGECKQTYSCNGKSYSDKSEYEICLEEQARLEKERLKLEEEQKQEAEDELQEKIQKMVQEELEKQRILTKEQQQIVITETPEVITPIQTANQIQAPQVENVKAIEKSPKQTIVQKSVENNNSDTSSTTGEQVVPEVPRKKLNWFVRIINWFRGK